MEYSYFGLYNKKFGCSLLGEFLLISMIFFILAIVPVLMLPTMPISNVQATSQAPEGKDRDIESGFYNEEGYVTQQSGTSCHRSRD